MKDRLRVAWFSTLNCGEKPGGSACAYFSDEVLPHLAARFDIELFHAEFLEYRDLPTFHYLKAFERHKLNPFNLFLYQLEDSTDAHFVRAHLGLIPGAILFHDLLLYNHGPDPLRSSNWRSVVERFVGFSGGWPHPGKKAGQALYRFRSRDRSTHWRLDPVDF